MSISGLSSERSRLTKGANQRANQRGQRHLPFQNKNISDPFLPDLSGVFLQRRYQSGKHMSDSNHFSDRLRDPLNDTTRKVRRNLMAASAIGVVITKVGLVPSKISAFGIEFTSSNQQVLLTLLAISIGYFAVSFIVYVYSELTAWQVVLASKELEEIKRAINEDELKIFGTVSTERIETRFRFLSIKTKPTFYTRILFEVAIPLVFACYSCYALIKAEPPKENQPSNVITQPANKSQQKGLE